MRLLADINSLMPKIRESTSDREAGFRLRLIRRSERA